jgi:DNA replication and repair protein RecF
VSEDIPEDWDARRVEIRMIDGENGRISVVQQ